MLGLAWSAWHVKNDRLDITSFVSIHTGMYTHTHTHTHIWGVRGGNFVRRFREFRVGLWGGKKVSLRAKSSFLTQLNLQFDLANLHNFILTRTWCYHIKLLPRTWCYHQKLLPRICCNEIANQRAHTLVMWPLSQGSSLMTDTIHEVAPATVSVLNVCLVLTHIVCYWRANFPSEEKTRLCQNPPQGSGSNEK